MSDEAFWLLVLDNELEVWWNQKFEEKQNNPNAQICAPEYQKKCVDLFQKGPSEWSAEGKLIYYNLKEQLPEVMKIKQEFTDKFLMKFCSEAGVKASQYFSSTLANKIKFTRKWEKWQVKLNRLLKEIEVTFSRNYRNGTVLFPPAVVDVDGHGPMGV